MNGKTGTAPVTKKSLSSRHIFQLIANGGLLDVHCTGDNQSLISGVFAELKRELPELLQAVMERQGSQSVTSIEGHHLIDQQQVLRKSLMSMLGFDFNAGRLDV